MAYTDIPPILSCKIILCIFKKNYCFNRDNVNIKSLSFYLWHIHKLGILKTNACSFKVWLIFMISKNYMIKIYVYGTFKKQKWMIFKYN